MPSPALCSTMPLWVCVRLWVRHSGSGLGKQKVTLLGGTAIALGGLAMCGPLRARCFHCMAQRSTTLWRRRKLCRSQTRQAWSSATQRHTDRQADILSDNQTQQVLTHTHLLLAVQCYVGAEAAHVSGVCEDVGHSFPQQLISIELGSLGQPFLLSVLLCDPQPPGLQHLDQNTPRDQTSYSVCLMSSLFYMFPLFTPTHSLCL